MIRGTPRNAASGEAIDRLRDWDFHMDRDKVEPLLFTAWLREFSREILFGRFGDAVSGYWDLKPRAMGASSFRSVREPGLQSNPGAARLARPLDPDLGRI